MQQVYGSLDTRKGVLFDSTRSSIMQKGKIVATSRLLHKHRRNMLPKRSGQPRDCTVLSGQLCRKAANRKERIKVAEPPNSGSSIAGLAPATMVVVQPPRRCLRGVALPSRIPINMKAFEEVVRLYKTPIQRVLRMQPTPTRVAVIS